jgi:hypothetical protein
MGRLGCECERLGCECGRLGCVGGRMRGGEGVTER